MSSGKVQSLPGDELVRWAEPIDIKRDRSFGKGEWFVIFQLDGQKLNVGLHDLESLKRLGVLVGRALKEASKG